MNLKNYLKRINTFSTRVKKNNELLEAIEVINNSCEDEWNIIKSFVVELQDEFAENALFEEDNELRRSNKYYIKGMLDIVLLPDIRKQVMKEIENEELLKETEKKEAERKKFNPGSWFTKKGIK